MEFIAEKDQFVHYNEAGKVDAEVFFEPAGDHKIAVTHTFVDPSLRGQGVGKQLVDLVAEMARKENKKLVPVCPYVVDLFERSSDYDDVKA